MNKNYLGRVFFILLFIAGWSTGSCAEEWVPALEFGTAWIVSSDGLGTGAVTTEGTTINLTANGNSNGGFFGALNKIDTTGIVGMYATLRVDQVSGNCDLGLQATIGQIGTKQIQVSIFLSEYNGQEGIEYRIRMYDMFTEMTVLVATGTFGPWDGAWVPGKPQSVAFERVESELWFYADGYKQVHKIQMLDGITSINESLAGYVNAPMGMDVSITGSISDIYLVYK
ncbi:MAG: hypothetical protein HY881_11465 [Deltaproteobacteria bacterium]|nr:hypothetical protein [Deltaproteobacteria bacterium]